MTQTVGKILALVNHPNLDILLGPVLVELQSRGHEVKALVVEAGRPDRLARLQVPLVDELTEFDAFLAESGPRLMLNGADLIPLHKLGIHTDMLCRGAGVSTLTLEHAPFALGYNDEFPPHVDFAADVMAVIGQEDRLRYEALGVDPSRLMVTGSPAFDHLVRAHQAYQSAPEATTIAVFGQSHTWTGEGSSQGIDPDAWRSQLSLLYHLLCERYPHAEIKIKPHPAEPFHGTEVLYREAVPAEFSDRITVLPTDADNARLILESRYVISFSSTIWLEAKILGRPCIFFTLQKRQGRLARDIPAMGGIWIPGKTVDFVARLIPQLDAIDEQATATEPERFPELEHYTGPLDGGSSGRVADAVETILDKGSPQVPVPILVFDGPHVPPRRLRSRRSYADYVHLQAVADACALEGVQQPFVLAVLKPGIPLREHLPLAQYTQFTIPDSGSFKLPYEDGAFDCLAAPDLFLHIEEPGRDLVLRELMRVTRVRIVTSLPTILGRNQLGELKSLVNLPPDFQHDLSGDEGLDILASWLREDRGWKVLVRDCHQVMSWAQSMILEHSGFDENALRTLRLSAQATGYPCEDRGYGVRRIYSITRNIEKAGDPAVIQ